MFTNKIFEIKVTFQMTLCFWAKFKELVIQMWHSGQIFVFLFFMMISIALAILVATVIGKLNSKYLPNTNQL